MNNMVSAKSGTHFRRKLLLLLLYLHPSLRFVNDVLKKAVLWTSETEHCVSHKIPTVCISTVNKLIKFTDLSKRHYLLEGLQGVLNLYYLNLGSNQRQKFLGQFAVSCIWK